MSDTRPAAELSRTCSPEFWDALAPYHALIEDNYFDRRSVRRLLGWLPDPVLIVGGGQGLIVAELRNRGIRCDGIDSSPEMIRYARERRGVNLIKADAKAMPFAPGTYKTIIYATGVIDFIPDEQEIRTILEEGRRIANDVGRVIVAFYRLNDAQEQFMKQVGLLANNQLWNRQSLEIYRLKPHEMAGWVARRAGVSRLRAVGMLLGMAARCRPRDIRTTFRMQRVFRDAETARALCQTAPERQPYRNATEIGNLFQRVGIPMKELRLFPSCFIVEI